ncbi:MAG: hypothetical protein AB7I33_16400 [Gemmatimonadales bacterium]
MRWIVVSLLAAILTGPAVAVRAQAPTGLAAAVLADSGFTWLRQTVPGFRVYFQADTYPARHQDSLLARLPPAARHAASMLQVEPLPGPIDVFFIESRGQMTRMIGRSATGFAQPSTGTVFLVTNPTWRAFERHEIMHVVAARAWGQPAPGNDWLMEGLAQAADGRCGGYSNTGVMLALAEQRGWIPLATLLTDFRSQPDLRAYLQAASFVQDLLRRFGPEPLRRLWTQGARPDSNVAGEPLEVREREWRAHLPAEPRPGPEELGYIELRGCG